MIGEALRESSNDPDPPLRLAQEERATVARDVSAIESRDHFSSIDGMKSERPLLTLCRH